MGKGLNREFKKCYHRKSGKVKSMAPAFYENKAMMARLGWELLPEAEAPETNANETEMQRVQQAAKTEAPPKVKKMTTAERVDQDAFEAGLPKEPKPAEPVPVPKEDKKAEAKTTTASKPSKPADKKPAKTAGKRQPQKQA